MYKRQPYDTQGVLTTEAQARQSMELSLRWARRSQAEFARLTNPNALFGIVQGGMYEPLREASLAALAELDLPGYAIGGGRTGGRLSPVTPSNDAGPDSDPQALMRQAVRELAPLKLAYLHCIEGQTGGARDVAPFDYADLRALAGGTPWMVNNGYTREMAQQAVAEGRADLVAFGRPFIANPDLGLRLRQNAAQNALDVPHLYGGGAQGYTDYPTLHALSLIHI